MSKFDEKVVIVTGGTRGIGLAITRAFLAEGASVAAVYRKDVKAAELLADDEAGAGGRLRVVQGDVSDRAAVERVVSETVDAWGRVDVLINNAGVFDFGYLDEMPEAFVDHMIDVNLKGTINAMQAVLPHMKARNTGRIVNASSISGHFADVGLIAYAASKAGVDMTTRLAAAELGPYGITVNAYAPGIIDTDMTHDMIEERGDVQVRQIPIGGFGRAEDVAALVLFLCSDEASYITGEIIGVDGGMMKVQNPYRAIDRAEQEG